MTVLLVALGAAVGAPLRYLTDRAVQSRHSSVFPWGTLTVNTVGSLLLGFLVGLPASSEVLSVAGTGLCGALTTYSTFSYETLRLAGNGTRRQAVANVVVSLAVGLAAAFAGVALGRAIGGPAG
ncbi:fluoride efflux transporter CrcB [Parafrankia discariae]|uniref:fluoride efflux transporter CrcB n=1 Tax=Parafrankia discariae TaxID=365528 RepID=UPI0003645AF9|nr:fluoride efflux transporter CrcB [Parafrankia discariae]